MKKWLKWSLIGLGSLIGLIAIFFVFMFLKFKAETKEMNPIATSLITGNVYTVLDKFSNVYIK